MPEIDLILGGHEHEALYVAPDASRHAPISKADSNVRSVYIHRLSYDTDNRNLARSAPSSRTSPRTTAPTRRSRRRFATGRTGPSTGSRPRSPRMIRVGEPASSTT